MSERVSVSLTLGDEEWTTLLAPFQRQGSRDPLIAEIRRTLQEGEPDWVTSKNRPDLVSRERLESVQSAIELKISRLKMLPDGQARDAALSSAENSAALARKLLEEIQFSAP